FAPSFSRWSVISERAWSHPEIWSGVARSRISASPLIPTPPAPTKWMRRSRRNLIGSPLHLGGEHERSQLLGGSGLGERAALPPHLDELRAVPEELGDRPGEAPPGERRLLHHDRRARPSQRLRVGELVSAGRGLERDQDRGAPRGHELG